MNSETTKNQRIAVVDGTTLTVDVLRWREPAWEFDCPVCVLRPVVRYSPNGESADQMVEDMCLSAAVDGYLDSEPTEGGIVDRVYPLKSLKRRWGMARGGKEFPRMEYAAFRFTVRFYDEDGELAFDVEEVE